MALTYIELNQSDIRPKKKSSLKKRIAIGLVAFLLFIGGTLGYFGPRVLAVKKQTDLVIERAQKIQNSLADQNIMEAKNALSDLKGDLDNLKVKLNSLKPIKVLPIVSGYLGDGEHLLNASIYAQEALTITVDSFMPYASVFGFEGEGSSKTTAEEKVQALVRALPGFEPKVDQIAEKIKLANLEMGYVSENRYPQKFKIKDYEVRKTLKEAKEFVSETEQFLPYLKPILKALPIFLGEPSEKTYLIWLQNDKELRPTGGFLTAYAIAKIKEGKIADLESEDLAQLDLKLTYEPQPPAPLRKYLKVEKFYIRDTNLSPDYVVSAKEFENFYSKIKGVPKVDGILALDTEFVSALLKVTGPVTTKKYRETFSAEINQTYGIPDAVYKLELYVEKLLAGREERKDVIGDLMDALLNKVLNSPDDKWWPLLQAFWEETQEKHLLFYSHDTQVQELLEKYNFAGRIKDYDGDYLHVNDSNFAGAKANIYIEQKIEQDLEVEKDGTIKKTVKITQNNTGAHDGWLNGPYNDWQRVYVPKGSELISKEVVSDFESGDELGKTVFKSYSKTLPKSSSSSIFTYKLPFKQERGSEYKLLIQKQPGTAGAEVIIRLNGKEIQKFKLTSDKEIKFKI